MANYQNLEAYMKSRIYENDQHAIKGDDTQDVLDLMIKVLGFGFQFGGIATPDGIPDETDARVFYLAVEPGTYDNYGGVELEAQRLGVITYSDEWAIYAIPMLSEVNTDDIVNAAVTASKIAGDAVETDKIKDGAVTTNKIADEAVNTGKIADEAVTHAKLASDAVESGNIKDGAVGAPKLADNAVESSKIKDGAVTTDKVDDKAITHGKLDDNAVEGDNIKDGAVTTDKLDDAAATTPKIADAAVVLDKLDNDVKVLLGSMVVEDVEEGTITAQNNHRYNIIEDVEDLAVTLPTPIAGRTSKVIVNFIAGFTPTMSIDGGEIPVIYPEIELKHHREYLVTITYNGNAWRASLECLTPENCLTFQNKLSFSMQISNIISYDGRLEYSTNLHDWQKVTGAGIMYSQRNGIRHKVYVRGEGNTYVKGYHNLIPPADYGISVPNNTQCVGNINTLLNYKDPDNVSYGSSAFQRLFVNTIGLIVAPDLPQTELTSSCYEYMFKGCTSLKHAPDLPATTLPSICYHEMFSGCTLLESVKMLATTLDSNSLKDWLKNVAAEGTLTKDATMADLPSGASGVPNGWTTVDA